MRRESAPNHQQSVSFCGFNFFSPLMETLYSIHIIYSVLNPNKRLYYTIVYRSKECEIQTEGNLYCWWYVERTVDRWRRYPKQKPESRSRILWVCALDFHSFKVRSEADRTRRWCVWRSHSDMSYKVSRCVSVCASIPFYVKMSNVNFVM